MGTVRPAVPDAARPAGGESDGRFIADICSEVVEFGPINASIHRVDEHVRIADIEPLAEIYRCALHHLLLCR